MTAPIIQQLRIATQDAIAAARGSAPDSNAAQIRNELVRLLIQFDPE